MTVIKIVNPEKILEKRKQVKEEPLLGPETPRSGEDAAVAAKSNKIKIGNRQGYAGE